MKLATTFEFDERNAAMSAIALQIVREALGQSCSLEHREIVSRELLWRKPELIGALSAVAREGNPRGAIDVALGALAALYAADPLLREVELTSKQSALAWSRAARPNFPLDQLEAEVDRANAETRARMVYEARQKLLAEQGADEFEKVQRKIS